MPRRLIALKTFTAADLASVDPQTAELKNDFTVIITGGMSRSGHIFLFERFRQRGGEALGILNELFRQMTIYKSTLGFVEKNRWESLMATGNKLVTMGVFGEVATAKRLIGRVRQLPHYSNKKERIRVGIHGYLKSHSLWFPSNWPETKEQILLHPAVENDDDLDVIEMLCSNMTPPTIDIVDVTQSGDRMGNRNTSHLTINEILAQRKFNPITGTFKDGKKNKTRHPQGYVYGG